jgi:hypothetical protein
MRMPFSRSHFYAKSAIAKAVNFYHSRTADLKRIEEPFGRAKRYTFNSMKVDYPKSPSAEIEPLWRN